MRRPLALIPAVVLVLGLASAAQADQPPTMTASCVGHDGGSTVGATATVTKEDSSTTTSSGAPIFLLDGLTVLNTCKTHYALIEFRPTHRCPEPRLACHTFFVVAPGASRTLNGQALTHLGAWRLPFTTWGLTLSGRFTSACAARGPFTNFLVRPDGKVVTRPCGPPPP